MYESLFENTREDDSTLEVNDKIYYTSDAGIHTSYHNTQNQYSIKVKDLDKWLLPHESSLRVKWCLGNAAGDAPIPETSAGVVTLASGGMHLFKAARLLVNDNVVENIEGVGYVHLIERLMDATRDQLESISENEWIYLDGSRPVFGAVAQNPNVSAVINSVAFNGTNAQVHMIYSGANPMPYLRHTSANVAEVPEVVNPGPPPVLVSPREPPNADIGGYNPAYREGYRARWQRTVGGRDVELDIPVKHIFGFFADIKQVYKGIQFEIQLEKNTDYSSILHGRGSSHIGNPGVAQALAAPAQTVIKEIRWRMPIVIPSTKILEHLEKQLQSGLKAKKYFHSTTMYTRVIPAAATTDLNIDWTVSNTGKRINRVVVAFQSSNQYSTQNDTDGSVLLDHVFDPSTFSRFVNIDSVEVRFGGLTLPRERYQYLQWADGAANPPNVIRLYRDFLETSGKLDDEDGNIITYEQYRNIYPLICFDLTNVDITKSQSIADNLRIVARGTTVGNEPYRIIAFVTYENSVEFAGVDGKLGFELVN